MNNMIRQYMLKKCNGDKNHTTGMSARVKRKKLIIDLFHPARHFKQSTSRIIEKNSEIDG